MPKTKFSTKQRSKLSWRHGLGIIGLVVAAILLTMFIGYVQSQQFMARQAAEAEFRDIMRGVSYNDSRPLSYDKASDSYLIPELRLSIPSDPSLHKAQYVYYEVDDGEASVYLRGDSSLDRDRLIGIGETEPGVACYHDFVLTTIPEDDAKLLNDNSDIFIRPWSFDDDCARYRESSMVQSLQRALGQATIF